MSESTFVNHKREITGLIYIVLAIIFGISYYLPESITGILGQVLRGFGKGLIGTAAFAIPVLLMYAAIDYFLEKRAGVAPIRVKSVLMLLLCVSSLFAVITVDPEVIKQNAMDPTGNGALASRAFSVLWSSGIDPSSIQTEGQGLILPGGLLGGIVALSLSLLAAKTGAVIIVIAFILSQIILIFNVSLKTTATRTADAIIYTKKKASEAIQAGRRAHREQAHAQTEKGSDEYIPVENVVDFSPFEEIDVDAHPGFIDLEGTDTPMNASSFRTGGSPFDMDLSKPPIPAESDEAQGRTKQVVPQKVNTDFIRDPDAPLPTAHLYTDNDLPDFLRPRKQGGWIDIRTGEVVSDKQSIRRLDENGQPIEPVNSEGGPPMPMPAYRAVASSDSAGRSSQSSSSDVSSNAPKQTTVAKASRPTYRSAPASLLRLDRKGGSEKATKTALAAQGKKLVDTLASFGVEAKVVNVTHGPAITRFELAPGPGIKVSRIVNLTDDLALAMAAVGVRIEAPIPGKSAIGIEIPNTETTPVTLRSLIDSPAFRKQKSPLTVALGRDIPGNPIFCDLTTMPHLLIAGATGSGKSVCINSILISILCKSSPDEVKMLLIDPKVVELSIYNGIPHLLAPVVTDPKKAANTLNWAVGEMTRRYSLFAESSVRDYRGYNEVMKMNAEEKLPLILIVIDELADLMQVASKEVEEAIARLTAMARAAGIHLLIATQRPSVDVITGVIKANIPSRIAFAVSSQVDSRTILDMSGGEKLQGKGDMLYYPQHYPKPQRGQGAFVSDHEVESVIDYLKAQDYDTYDPEVAEEIVSASLKTPGRMVNKDENEDELLPQAVEIVLTAGCASVSILQRKMNIGYPRAARLIDTMEEKNYIGPFEGSKPRKLLITQTQWLEIQSRGE